ncbi:MAG: sulfotransferase domain-containing protein [Flavobacteriaceae bacterium]|nr:sulfotransferase domain-containing protein [Flavobacteriaceae bacterium]
MMKRKIKEFINRARWELQKILHFVRPIRYEKTAWVLGVGRSGTTWVSSLINYQNRYIEWFEPFHKFNQKLVSLDYHNFKPLNSKCTQYAEHIFSGKEYYQCWSEKFRKQPLFPSKDLLIVKDITMNLSAYRLCGNNAKLKPILLIRNPFAVVLSQQSKKWKFGKEFENALTNSDCLYIVDLQNIIMEGVIQKIIKNRSDFEEKILMWAILNYVPLKQFRENTILVTFYEDWVMNADKEMKRVCEYLELPVPQDNIMKGEKYKKPSRMALRDKEKFSIDTWKEKISEKDYQAGMRILKLFGFDDLYDENSLPNRECLNKLRIKR